MEEQSITRYEPYNDKYVILYGNKERFDSLITALKGKWYPKLGAWLVPKEQEKKVSVLVNALMNEEVLDKLRKRGKSRKDQQKYKRENSDDEKSSSSEEETQESSSRSRRNSRSGKVRSAEIRKETLLETESSDSGEDSYTLWILLIICMVKNICGFNPCRYILTKKGNHHEEMAKKKSDS